MDSRPFSKLTNQNDVLRVNSIIDAFNGKRNSNSNSDMNKNAL